MNKKKTHTFLIIIAISITLMLWNTQTVGAANPTASISASASTVKAGENISYTVSISGVDSATSAAVNISHSGNFEVVTGEWLKSGVIANYDASQSKGAFSYASAASMNGNLFRLTLKAKSTTSSASVSIHVQVKNGTALICDKTVSANTKITCATHSYGSWTTIANASCSSGGREQRACSVCGNVETKDTGALGHNWGSYTTTKEATCTDKGTKTRTCSRCNQTETQSIPAKGHTIGNTNVTKKPTCTEKGEKTGTCKTCGEKLTQPIDATGHSFGEWKETTAPTFGEAGVETRTCTDCAAEETRNIDSLGYAFSEPTTAKDSVFVYYDVTAQVNADTLSKSGYANVRFAVPEGAGNEVKLYYVSESGALEEISATLSEDGTVIEAQITKLGTYAVCKIMDGEADITVNKMPADEEMDNVVPMPGKTNIPWIWIIATSLETIVILGFIGYKIWLKKK